MTCTVSLLMMTFLVWQVRSPSDEGAPDATPCVDVFPHSGTLVLFRADHVLHEVRPAFRERFACSMWFHHREPGSAAAAVGVT